MLARAAEAARSATPQAARELFAIPTFFVGKEMVFGKERFGQVEEAVEAAKARA